MFKKIKAVVILSVLFLMFSGCATAGVEVSALKDLPPEVDMKNLPTAAQYPDSDGIILYENVAYDVDYVPGVGMETYKTFHKIYRVFNNEDDFMANILDFDERTSFESFSARTIKPDGRIIDLKQEDIYQLIFKRTNQDFTGNMYAIAYNFPALNKGDVIELKFKVISRYFYFSDIYYVQSNLPKLYSRFEIKIPNFIFDAEFEFTYKVKNIEIKEPSYTKGIGDSGDRSYVWENRNIPKFKPEPLMGNDDNYRGLVEMQLAYWNTWNGLAREVYDMNFKPVLEGMSKKDKEKIASKVKDLTSGIADDLEKIKVLTKFVQTFKYSDTANYFGHATKPNEIGLVLDREYGDCKDHAMVLTAMLQEIGIKAWPALIAAYDPSGIDPKFVTDIFNHAMVKVILDGGEVLLLDPTSKFTQFGKLPEMDEDTYLLETRPKAEEKEYKIKLEKTPKSNYSDNMVEKIVKGKIENDVARYEVTIKSTGHMADFGRYGFEYAGNKVIETMIRRNLLFYLYDAKISDIAVKNLNDTEKPLIFTYTVELKKSENGMIPVVPVGFFNEFIYPNEVYLEDRTKPVVVSSLYRTKETYEMSYDPEKYSVTMFEKLVNSEFSLGNTNSWKVSNENGSGKISFTLEYAQKEKVVKTENIPELLKKVTGFSMLQRAMYRTNLVPKAEDVPVEKTEEKIEEKVETK